MSPQISYEVEISLENTIETLQKHVGLMLIKPDAINLGIGEDIINHVTQIMYPNANLTGVYIIDNITVEQIPIIYPELPSDGYEIVYEYLTSGPCILFGFTSDNEESNLLNTMKKIKGPRLIDWRDEYFEYRPGITSFIRATIPVPGTEMLYKRVIEKILLKRNDPTIRFTDDEFKIYCQNLVHSPDNFKEMFGLLSLVSENEKKEMLGDYYNLFKQTINLIY